MRCDPDVVICNKDRQTENERSIECGRKEGRGTGGRGGRQNDPDYVGHEHAGESKDHQILSKRG